MRPQCLPTTVTIDWADEPDVEYYVLQIGGGCVVGTTIVVPGSTSQYTVSGLANGQTYYIKVRSLNYCGASSYWSPCRSFTTEPIPSPYYTFTSPSSGDYCQDSASVTVSWDPMPRVDFYQVKLGETCGLGEIHNVYPPLTESTFTSLLDSTTLLLPGEDHGRMRQLGRLVRLRQLHHAAGDLPCAPGGLSTRGLRLRGNEPGPELATGAVSRHLRGGVGRLLPHGHRHRRHRQPVDRTHPGRGHLVLARARDPRMRWIQLVVRVLQLRCGRDAAALVGDAGELLP